MTPSSLNQPPLPPQTTYWNRAEDRQRAVNALFDRSAEQYDRACEIMSFGSGQTYRRAALERGGLRQGMHVLDVGTGTGLVACEVAHLLGSSGRVIGIDPSLKMMAAGRDRSRVDLVQSLGECLPFPDCARSAPACSDQYSQVKLARVQRRQNKDHEICETKQIGHTVAA